MEKTHFTIVVQTFGRTLHITNNISNTKLNNYIIALNN